MGLFIIPNRFTHQLGGMHIYIYVIWGCVKIRVWIGPRWSRRMERSGSPAFWYGSGVWIGLWVQGMDRGFTFWLAAICVCMYNMYIYIYTHMHCQMAFTEIWLNHTSKNREAKMRCQKAGNLWVYDGIITVFFCGKKWCDVITYTRLYQSNLSETG